LKRRRRKLDARKTDGRGSDLITEMRNNAKRIRENLGTLKYVTKDLQI
jgi:hypothetical protein